VDWITVANQSVYSVSDRSSNNADVTTNGRLFKYEDNACDPDAIHTHSQHLTRGETGTETDRRPADTGNEYDRPAAVFSKSRRRRSLHRVMFR